MSYCPNSVSNPLKLNSEMKNFNGFGKIFYYALFITNHFEIYNRRPEYLTYIINENIFKKLIF